MSAIVLQKVRNEEIHSLNIFPSLENYLKSKLGIKLIRTKVGDINVVSEMQKKSYVLGGEQSGHIILGNHMQTGDGILTAIKILTEN